MGDCNKCENNTCHKFIGLRNDCRIYVPPKTFKRSMMEHLAAKDATTVLRLLERVDLKVIITNDYPGFELVEV